jgi:hypothetical protein
MTDEGQTDNAGNEMRAGNGALSRLDLDALARLARSSEDREAYHAVISREHFRIGLVVEAAPDASISFRIEVLVQILAKGTQPKVADLERLNRILDDLARRGYSLDHHDGCWISCEREVTADCIENECRAILSIVRPKTGPRSTEMR